MALQLRTITIGSLSLLLSIVSVSAQPLTQCPHDIDELLNHMQWSGNYENVSFMVQHMGERDAFSRSERYEPLRLPQERWILLEMDGKQPSIEEQQRFAMQRAMIGNPLLYHLGDKKAHEFMLINDSDTTLSYHFRPVRMEVGSGKNTLDLTQHTYGSLTIENKPTQGCQLSINLFSRESFSPRTGIKVKRFSVTHHFRLDTESGLFFPESNVFELNGRAFLVKGFDVLNKAQYSDVAIRMRNALSGTTRFESKTAPTKAPRLSVTSNPL